MFPCCFSNVKNAAEILNKLVLWYDEYLNYNIRLLQILQIFQLFSTLNAMKFNWQYQFCIIKWMNIFVSKHSWFDQKKMFHGLLLKIEYIWQLNFKQIICVLILICTTHCYFQIIWCFLGGVVLWRAAK